MTDENMDRIREKLREKVKNYLSALDNGTELYEEMDDMVTMILFCLEQKEFDSAKRIFEVMKKSHVDESLTYLIDAKIQNELHNEPQAYESIRMIDEKTLKEEMLDEMPFAAHCALRCSDYWTATEWFRHYANHTTDPDIDFSIKYGGLLEDFNTVSGAELAFLDSISDIGLKTRKNTENLLNTSNAYAIHGNYAKCIDLLDEAVELEPLNSDIWRALMVSSARTRNIDKVIDCSDYYFALNPDETDFTLLMIRFDTLLSKEEWDKALEILDLCMKTKNYVDNTGNTMANTMMLYSGYARAYGGLKDRKKQEMFLRRAKKINPAEVTIIMDYVSYYRSCGKLDKAADVLREALKVNLDPMDIIPIMNELVQLDIERHEKKPNRSIYEEARNLIDSMMLKTDPLSWLALNCKLEIVDRNWDSALRYLHQAYDCGGDKDSKILLMFSIAYFMKKENKEFKRYFSEYKAIEPDAVNIFCNLFPYSKDEIMKLI